MHQPGTCRERSTSKDVELQQRVIKNFTGAGDGEDYLRLEEGELILVYPRKEDQGWAWGRSVQREVEGWFPPAFARSADLYETPVGFRLRSQDHGDAREECTDSQEPLAKPKLQPKAAPKGFQGPQSRPSRGFVQPAPPPRQQQQPAGGIGSEVITASEGHEHVTAGTPAADLARTDAAPREGTTPPTPPAKSPSPASSSTLPWHGYPTTGVGQTETKTHGVPMAAGPVSMLQEAQCPPPARIPATQPRPARSELLRSVQAQQGFNLGVDTRSNFGHPQTCSIVAPCRTSVAGHWDNYFSLLRKRAEEDGMTQGPRAQGLNDITYNDYWHCPFCQRDYREQDLEAHLNKPKHQRNKDYYCQVALLAAVDPARSQASWSVVPFSSTDAQQPSPPASWGDPKLYEWDPIIWKWKCKLCSKFADDSHVASEGHQKWVPFAGQYVPELRREDVAQQPSARPPNADVAPLSVKPAPQLAPWHLQPTHPTQAAQASLQLAQPQPGRSNSRSAGTECAWARGWYQQVDPSSGRPYYFRRDGNNVAIDNTTTWESPPADMPQVARAMPQMAQHQAQPGQLQQAKAFPQSQAWLPGPSTQTAHPCAAQQGAWQIPVLPTYTTSVLPPTSSSSGPQPPPPPPKTPQAVPPPPQAARAAQTIPPPPPPTGQIAEQNVMEF